MSFDSTKTFLHIHLNRIQTLTNRYYNHQTSATRIQPFVLFSKYSAKAVLFLQKFSSPSTDLNHFIWGLTTSSCKIT